MGEIYVGVGVILEIYGFGKVVFGVVLVEDDVVEGDSDDFDDDFDDDVD